MSFRQAFRRWWPVRRPRVYLLCCMKQHPDGSLDAVVQNYLTCGEAKRAGIYWARSHGIVSPVDWHRSTMLHLPVWAIWHDRRVAIWFCQVDLEVEVTG